MCTNTLNELFVDELKHVSYTEQQLVDALDERATTALLADLGHCRYLSWVSGGSIADSGSQAASVNPQPADESHRVSLIVSFLQ
jgi:hypothetical protein